MKNAAAVKSGFLSQENLFNSCPQTITDTQATLSSSDIAAVQQAAWTETVHYAFDRSPFYREHFARAELSPREKIPLDEIARIPAIDKAVVSEHTEQFLCVPREKIVDIVTTSGSTGQPLVWQLTENDLERLARNEQLSFGCAGSPPPTPCCSPWRWTAASSRAWRITSVRANSAAPSSASAPPRRRCTWT